MRTTGIRDGGRWMLTALIGLILGWQQPAAAITGDYSKYHTYQELSAAMKAMVTAHADIAKLVSIGKTREGRDIWAIEIAAGSGAAVGERPALLVAANFEGDHLIGSELALYLADYLVSSYATDAAVKQRLDSSAVYIVPRLNPDAAELMFAAVKTGRRTNSTPYDADNDARMDEDGPEDLNKDGVITVMRAKDPKGPYMISPDDARLMKLADPAKGERGGYALYTEGLDNDGDGFINEDGPGGVDINRNFMHQYPYFAADAGRYMVSEAETRALLEYVLKHRNIAAILTYGESDNLIAVGGRTGAANGVNLLEFAERSVADARRVGMFADTGGGGRGGGRGFVIVEAGGGPGGRGGQAPAAAGRGQQARAAATTVNAGDIEYLRTISDKYRELTGLRSAGVTRAPAGAFFEYGYYQFGVPSFSTPGWGLPAGGRAAAPAGGAAPIGQPAAPPAGFAGGAGGAGRGGRGGAAVSPAGEAAAEGIDLRLLQWLDAEKLDGFLAWAPFAHPTLGPVEIGGFKPYAITNPAASKIADLGASHAKFAMYLSSLFAHLTIAKAESTALGGGLYRIEVEVENTGFLPTALAHAVVASAVRPTMVQLGVPPESIVTGHEKTNVIPALAGSGTRRAYQWVIMGKPGTTITVKAVSQKGGSDTASLKLQ